MWGTVPSVTADVARLIPPTADNTVNKMEKRNDKLTSNKKTKPNYLYVFLHSFE
jgi:hypothetical protein